MLDRWSSAGLGLPRQITDQQMPQWERIFHGLPIDQEVWPPDSNDLGLWAHMIALVRHFGPIQDLNRLIATNGASEAHVNLTVSKISHELENWQNDLPENVRLSTESLSWHKA